MPRLWPGEDTTQFSVECREPSPSRVVAELGAWERHSYEEVQAMLASLKKLREEGKAVIID